MKRRIIPVLTLLGGKLVKTKQFQHPRNLNSPLAAAEVFNAREADELVILTIGGAVDYELLERMASVCFMPLAIGGGIRSMKDVDRLFALGADKVVIRSKLELIPLVARKYGAQSVIQSLDEPNFMTIHPFAGEILLTSVQNDGMMEGYNLSLLNQVRSETHLPIIISGGCGKAEHMLQALQGGADAVAASSVFAYTENTPNSLKRYLLAHNIPVRYAQSQNH